VKFEDGLRLSPNLLAGLLLFYTRMLFRLPVAFFDLFRTAFPWFAL